MHLLYKSHIKSNFSHITHKCWYYCPQNDTVAWCQDSQHI